MRYGSPSPYTLGILRVAVRSVNEFAERIAESAMALDFRNHDTPLDLTVSNLDAASVHADVVGTVSRASAEEA